MLSIEFFVVAFRTEAEKEVYQGEHQNDETKQQMQSQVLNIFEIMEIFIILI